MFNTQNFDAKRLLDQFLGAPAAGNLPAQTGGQPQGSSAPGGLDGLLGGLTGMLGGGAPSAGPAQGGGDLVGRAKDYLSNNGGSLAGGAAAGALVSLVMGNKKLRKVGGNVAALGGLALVGTLAYKAYQNYQNGQAPAKAATPAPTAAQLPPPDSPFSPVQAARTQLPVTLLRTMIAASLADGHIDDHERIAISAKLNEGGSRLDEAEQFLTHELANPASVETIARDVSSEEEAAEVYLSALLAIDPDNSAERAFLARLAMALKLDPNLTPHLEAAARAARQG
ncbi:tellurite resistance TerB family protein [Ancylobacter sp. A5.8]|uniref:tellurite resistance TerB family protein n=1 Tax=Ancylobacter gelatini TaxID=2919920 RepID=UPI001F4F07BE|nr:tellurite resistance TerB family protein [Ancylobacter gelatini]MCJ8144788.1 tellurite resistance TerB family protein [Ancylobacter gelatini]